VIVDSSAIVAILTAEPDAHRLADVVEATSRLRVSAATVLETSVVLGESRRPELKEWLAEAGAEIVPFDERQLTMAWHGHRRFGKGSGSPARLNLGDCFAYALAMTTGEPLLFKGDDFAHTDVEPAYVP
jgi:ribonuclease VapC